MNILALDPATKCGWAHSTGMSGVWDLSVRRDESSSMRLVRLRGKLKDIVESLGVDLLVFESARNAGPRMQGALVVQSELQGVIKIFCEDVGVNYRGYSPTEIKKHATGNGKASKEVMVKAAEEYWPEHSFIDDNEADACWLLDLAKQEYGR